MADLAASGSSEPAEAPGPRRVIGTPAPAEARTLLPAEQDGAAAARSASCPPTRRT